MNVPFDPLDANTMTAIIKPENLKEIRNFNPSYDATGTGQPQVTFFDLPDRPSRTTRPPSHDTMSTASPASYHYQQHGSLTGWQIRYKDWSPTSSSKGVSDPALFSSEEKIEIKLETREKERLKSLERELPVTEKNSHDDIRGQSMFPMEKMQALALKSQNSLNSLTDSRVTLYENRAQAETDWKEIMENAKASNSSLELILNSVRNLGCGAFGAVDEVTVPAREDSLARKRIRVSRRRVMATRDVKLIQEEIKNLKSLTHPHIVRIFGSYQAYQGTYKHSYCLLIHPVGDNDLGSFLEDECECIAADPTSELSITKSAWIMKWFTCLSSALAYMHSQHIHHEDIKPKNIIHKGEHVYFTDFNSSRKCKAAHLTSTASTARASRLFAAPEVFPTNDVNHSRHGSKTDVFSLGLVFVEMLTILEGNDIDDLHEYIGLNNGFGDTEAPKQYHRAVNLIDTWFTSDLGNAFFKDCIRPMLSKDRVLRPSAKEVVHLVDTRQPWGMTLACPCKEG